MTPRQQQLLGFIRERIEAKGIAPTFEDMKAAMGLASKSGVSRMVEELVRQGYLIKDRQRAHGLRLAAKAGGVVADLQSVPSATLIAELRRRGDLP